MQASKSLPIERVDVAATSAAKTRPVVAERAMRRINGMLGTAVGGSLPPPSARDLGALVKRLEPDCALVSAPTTTTRVDAHADRTPACTA